MSSTKLIRFLLVWLLALAQQAVPALSATDKSAGVQASTSVVSAPRSSSAMLSGPDLQRQVFDLLVADDFAQAEQLLADSLELSANDQARLKTWLADYQQFLGKRIGRRNEVAEKHIAESRKSITEQKFQEALASAYLAALVSPDPQTLRRETWLDELVQRCAQEAEKLSEQGEYGKAALILREISLIFGDDKSWKQRFEQTGLHAGILGAYGQESEWQQRLQDAETTDFESAVLKIDKYFVKAVDYRKMLLGALKGIRSFLTTRRLEEAFPSMVDKQAVVALKDFLNTKIDSTQNAPHVTLADLIKIYWQIVLKNRQGLRLPDQVIVDLLTNQACQAIDDYTEIIWPEQQKWFSRTTTGSFTGIGVQIRVNQAKQLEVVTPLVGTPAFKAGLQAADLIVAVDEKNTEGITINEAVRRITGQKGTIVTLTIRRPGRAEEFDVPIVRDVIKISSVLGYSRLPNNGWNYIVDDSERIAYLRISNFMRNTAKELDQALKACRDQNARALIVDLRFDPGGTLKAAEEVSDRFLSKGQTIVSTRGRWAKPYLAKAYRPDSCAGWPVVLLTSDKSASASEIVAGALQDHNRASIVGERTFGKGLVQRPFRLRPNADGEVGIKVTTAYWYLPKGRNVQREDDSQTWGVEPDLQVDLTPQEFQSLRKRWLDAEVIHGPDESSPEKDPEEPPAKDPSEAGPQAGSHPPAEPDEKSGQQKDGSTENMPTDLPDPQLQTALLMIRLQLLMNQN